MSNTYLSPIEKPHSLTLRLIYFLTDRLLGKVPTPLTVVSARMPLAFLFFYGKVSRLDKKLKLSAGTIELIRERVAIINGCAFCMDITRWYATRKFPDDPARMDALPDYRTSALFTDAERAALDYASELTEHKHVQPETFEALQRYYSEREICDIVWLVASEHLYNMSNIGLDIGSDGLCDLRARRVRRAA